MNNNADSEGKICQSREVEILLVEDDPNDIELLTRLFRKHRLVNKVVLIKDGAEALDFFFGKNGHVNTDLRNNPKVIFLDLKMPRVDGIEVLRRLKSDNRTKQIPVIILTGSKEERDLRNSYDLGVNGYVTKPLKFERFASVISEMGMNWLLLNEPPL